MGLQAGSVGQAAKDGLYFKSRDSLSSALPAVTLGQRQIKGHSRQATGQGHGLQGAQKDPWKRKKMEGGNLIYLNSCHGDYCLWLERKLDKQPGAHFEGEWVRKPAGLHEHGGREELLKTTGSSGR